MNIQQNEGSQEKRLHMGLTRMKRTLVLKIVEMAMTILSSMGMLDVAGTTVFQKLSRRIILHDHVCMCHLIEDLRYQDLRKRMRTRNTMMISLQQHMPGTGSLDGRPLQVFNTVHDTQNQIHTGNTQSSV